MFLTLYNPTFLRPERELETFIVTLMVFCITDTLTRTRQHIRRQSGVTMEPPH
jgi:hypothetical protein